MRRSMLSAAVLLVFRLTTAAAQPGCAYFFHKHQAETLSSSDRLDSAITAYRRAFAIHTHDLADLLAADSLLVGQG